MGLKQPCKRASQVLCDMVYFFECVLRVYKPGIPGIPRLPPERGSTQDEPTSKVCPLPRSTNCSAWIQHNQILPHSVYVISKPDRTAPALCAAAPRGVNRCCAFRCRPTVRQSSLQQLAMPPFRISISSALRLAGS